MRIRIRSGADLAKDLEITQTCDGALGCVGEIWIIPTDDTMPPSVIHLDCYGIMNIQSALTRMMHVYHETRGES